MRRVRAFDKETRKFVGIQRAKDKSEQTRRSHTYKCLNTSCSCTFHWRQKVVAKENTEARPATFVKNKSSGHIVGCRYDFTEVAKEYRDVVYTKDDILHLRIQFPLGTTRSDLRPWIPGALSERQRRAANANIDKMGFGSMNALMDFVNKRLGGLDDPILDEVVLHYQGLELGWNELFVASDEYSKLVRRGRGKDQQGQTLPTFSVVKPSHEGAKTPRGNHRFICETQEARPDKRLMEITPVLVCKDEFTVACLNQIVEHGDAVLVASRPYIVEPQRGNTLFAYLHFTEGSQYTRISKSHWHHVMGRRDQQSFDF